MDRSFSVQEARQLMPDVLARASEVITVRADLIELQAALAAGKPSRLGGLPEAKGLQARFSELLAWFPRQGLEVRAWPRCCWTFRGGSPASRCCCAGSRARPSLAGTTSRSLALPGAGASRKGRADLGGCGHAVVGPARRQGLGMVGGGQSGDSLRRLEFRGRVWRKSVGHV